MSTSFSWEETSDGAAASLPFAALKKLPKVFLFFSTGGSEGWALGAVVGGLCWKKEKIT